jgi:nucleotide-binding universal stress UspA family protein
MAGFHHILFPVDFSERCRAVRPFVVSLAQKFNAKITMMHTLGVPRGFYGGVDASYPIVVDWDAMKSDSVDHLLRFLSADESIEPSQSAGQEMQAVAVIGEPAAEIVNFTLANDVDLIMMPTHGYGPFRTMLLGSVTAKVLHDCDCPVWTAAHTDAPTLPEHVKCDNVMCAVDTTPEAVRVMQRAVEMAGQLHAKLRVVHAVPPVDHTPTTRFEDVFRADILRIGRESIMKLQAEAGCEIELCMEMGPVSKVVRAAALHHDADLVIIGHGKVHEALGRLRTNAYTIIRDAPCPVLSL